MYIQPACSKENTLPDHNIPGIIRRIHGLHHARIPSPGSLVCSFISFNNIDGIACQAERNATIEIRDLAKTNLTSTGKTEL